MSGLYVEGRQMKLYTRSRHTDSPAAAAAKVGGSISEASQIEVDPGPRGRRPPDPLARVWDAEVLRFERHEIEWTTEKSKRLWNYYGWNPKYREMFFGFRAGRFVARIMFSEVRAANDARFLDFSCGWGDVIAACIPRLRGAQEIYATDFCDTYVNAANERFGVEPRFKGAILNTAFPSPFPVGHFDVVFATDVIEHLNDDELDGMLAECKRVLKPGGHVLFTTPNNEDYDAAKLMCPDCGCVYHKWQHVRTWSADTLRARMEKAGLVTCSVKAVAWRSWKGKLLELVRPTRLDKDGLVYIGQARW